MCNNKGKMKHPIRVGIFRECFKVELLLLSTLLYFSNVYGALSVISEDTGDVVRIIDEKNIRSMSDALEGYLIPANPFNVCTNPDPPPVQSYDDLGINGSAGNNGSGNGTVNGSFVPKKWVLLAVISECDLTTKARNAQQAGYSGLIVVNVGTNNSHLVPWVTMRFPLAKINHVVVGEYDGHLLRYNYSYPENSYYVRFDEDHFYQILCYVLAGIILVLLITMFLLFWFQICCTIVAMRLPYRFSRRVQRWLHPGKRRLTRPMLQSIPVQNWTHTDTYQVCAICQEDFKEEDKIRVLPCVHAFHSVCIDPWLLKRSRRCPNCMQRVRLPNDREEEEESEYSNHANNRNQSRRRCSQSSHEHRNGNNGESNGSDSAPLLQVPQSPKNTRITVTEEALEQQHIVTAEPVSEPEANPSISAAEDTSSSRDWQLKHFLQNFNYVPSDKSQSCSEHSDSGKGTGQRATDIPLCSMKVCKAESLLETCLDVPRSHSEDEVKDEVEPPQPEPVVEVVPMITRVTAHITTPAISILQSALLTRSVSNPGYVSSEDEESEDDDEGEANEEGDGDDDGGDDDDDDEDDQATEEQNLSSSFDATTVSESLPRDESMLSNMSQATIDVESGRTNSISENGQEAEDHVVVTIHPNDDGKGESKHIWYDPLGNNTFHGGDSDDLGSEGGGDPRTNCEDLSV